MRSIEPSRGSEMSLIDLALGAVLENWSEGSFLLVIIHPSRLRKMFPEKYGNPKQLQ